MKGIKLLAAAVLLVSFGCNAGAYGDDLTKCLLSKASDEDKENLMRWSFVMATKYPENRKFYSPPELSDEMTSALAASTLYRLTAVDCKKESDLVEKIEGKQSVANSMVILTNESWKILFKSQAVNDYLSLTDGFYLKEKQKAEENAARWKR